jgi:NAD(P)-dependent dehydrogenase (short-subunit alcohol dehydrogenase family)
MRLQGKVAVITGGGSGLGRAMALRFAEEGAAVAVADLIPERAAETAELIAKARGRGIGIDADVTDAAQVEAMVARGIAEFGQIDILVNNAGISVGDNILKIDEPGWDHTFDVCLKSAYLCSKAVLPGMIERRSGAILNISSVNAVWAIGKEAYSAAKAGMLNLTQNMALKYGDYGIRVNAISPGTVRTAIWDERLKKNPDVIDKLVVYYPLGRIGQPEDIANAALFLVSDDSSWITGINLPVDGGVSAGPYQMMIAVQSDGAQGRDVAG